MALSGLDRVPQEIGTDAQILARKYEVYGQTYPARFLNYMISEVDVSIRSGWFWRNEHEQSVRSADDVFDMYERSVGGNAVFLLNVPPASNGKLGPRDVTCLAEVGRRIRATCGTDLAVGFTTSANGISSSDLDTFWHAEGNQGSFEITLPTAQTINRIALQEAIGQVGQRVKSHAVDAWVDGAWKEVSKAGVIGCKRIHRIADVRTSKFRVRILDSRNAPSIATFRAHYDAAPPRAVTISRNAAGKVELGAGKPGEVAQVIHYTTDASDPTSSSTPYRGPFDLPDGGEVRACSVVGAQLGSVSRVTLGILPLAWKVTASSEHAGYEAAKAIDGNPSSFWHSSWADGHPVHPIHLTIELPEKRDIRGFAYLPRQDKRVPDSMVEAWRIEASIGGKDWRTLGQAEFGNLLNHPSQRVHLFPQSYHVKWLRFVSLRGVQDKPYAGAAEIELLAE